MTNEAISDQFSLLAKLIDIHGENSFKSKSYANAAFQIDRLPTPLVEMQPKAWAALRGIGATIAGNIAEMMVHETLPLLQEYIDKTPAGILDLLKIKGLGAKKIHTIWKEMEIETMGELLYACNENRLTLYKGFGEKTQQNVREAIEYLMSQSGRFLYQQALEHLELYTKNISSVFNNNTVVLTGDMRMHADTISSIDFLIDLSPTTIAEQMAANGYTLKNNTDETGLVYKMANAPDIRLLSCEKENAGTELLLTGSGTQFIEWINQKLGKPIASLKYADEPLIFKDAQLDFIDAPLRYIAASDYQYFKKHQNSEVVSVSNIRGIIHSHSKWSDGNDTLENMAKAAMAKGLEYLVISDHSKAASYAGGLREDAIIKQHLEIDELNKKLYPFRIFKSIECDILGDGSLDYSDDVLASFDLVIASIHSSIRMTEEKAMQRLLAAIENPYTMILGHVTGRLLLSRKGYPINHKIIIDACVANEVVLELNAHPRRLDMDFTWIPYALEKGVMISINPDAHSITGFDDIQYGVIAAAKALLPASQNLSSFSLDAFTEWLYETRQVKGI